MDRLFRHTKTKIRWLWYGLWLVVCLPGWAVQSPVVVLQVSKPEVAVGEVFQITIQLQNVPSGTRFRIQPVWKNLHIVSGPGTTPTVSPQKRSYQVMLLETGEYALAPQPLYLQQKEGTSTLYTPEVAVWCRPLPVVQPDLHLPALVTPSYSWQEWGIYIGAGLLVVLGWIMWGIYRSLRKGGWKRGSRTLNPAQQALRELKQLEASSVPDALFYKELAHIVDRCLTQLPADSANKNNQVQGEYIRQKIHAKRFAPPVVQEDTHKDELYRQVWEWITLCVHVPHAYPTNTPYYAGFCSP